MEFLRMAAEKSERSVENGGGPFGAVIVKNDEVLAVESNSVTIDNDPTAHAEVMPSVRHAARWARSNWMAATSIARASRVRCASAHFIGREWRAYIMATPKKTRTPSISATSLSMRNSNVRSRCAPFLASMCLIRAQSRHSACGVTRPTK